MTDFVPDPFKNFTPRPNPPKQAQPTASADNPLVGLSGAEMDLKIDSMTRDQLIAELKKHAAPIDLEDITALKRLARGKLVKIIQKSPETLALVPALRELVDRIDGKAPQSIAMTVKDEGLSKVATDRLIRLAAMLDEPLVIPPEPLKLGNQ